MRVLAIVAAVGLGGCTSSGAVECADGTLCPEGERCVLDDALPATQCAAPSSFAACDGLASGDACTRGVTAGTCFGGACIERRCGDHVVDRDEVCDDGNTVDGDGCSATCASMETCGNGVTDLSVGEQCDDDTPMLAGDGCSRTCVAEYRLWRDVSPDVPTSRTGFGLATDPMEGLVMFGGRTDVDGVVGETWRWTGTSWIAADLVDNGAGPAKRTRFAMAYDDVRHRVVMFGGFTGTGVMNVGLRDDTWEWDGLRWTDVSPQGATPTARSDATLACGGGRCILVGGKPRAGQGLAADCASTASPNTCDAWSWDGTTWTKLPDPPPTFTPRAHPAIAYHAGFGTFVIFGGTMGPDLGETSLGDTWELDAANAWTNHTQSGPLATAQPTAVANDASVLMVAGTSAWAYGSAAQHAWASRTAPLAWDAPAMAVDRVTARPMLIGTPLVAAAGGMAAQVYGTGPTGSWTTRASVSPNGGAGEAAAAYDRARGRTVVLDARNSTLEWDGVGWRQTVDLADGPTETDETALAYDARCGVTLAFGGRGPDGDAANRTWSYDGAAWSEVTPAESPPARSGHVMAYDPAHDAIVMFGGTSFSAMTPGVLFDDTWAWTGATCATRSWQRVTVTASPPGRRDAGLAFDASTEPPRMILFGGLIDDPGEPYNGETWQLELTSATSGAWKQLVPAASPSARAYHGMTTDPRRGRVVLFAGRSGDAVSEQDTWELDGDTWRAVATVTTPSRRHGFAIAFDVTGNVVIIGGENQADSAVTQVFRLSSENSLTPVERCILPTDDDGDGLAGCDDPDCWSRCAPACGPNMTCDAAAPRCGDGTCDPTEDFLLCADCAAP